MTNLQLMELKDACGFTNPKQATHEEIVAILELHVKHKRISLHKERLFI